MNSTIKYVQDGGETSPAENLTFTIKGNSHDVLNTDSVSAMGEQGTGAFTYANAFNAFQDSGILCVYMGTRPDERRIGAEDGSLEKARERLSVGDFVTLYTAESFEARRAVYGRVERVDGDTITYVPATEDAMLHSMDLYDQLEVADGEERVSEELQEELEALIQAQVERSGFAEEAAGLLSDVVAATDGFQENELVRRSLLYAQGASARSGGMGGTLANRPRVTVEHPGQPDALQLRRTAADHR